MKKIAWPDDVADKDHEAAFQYLSPRFDARRAGQIVTPLKAAEVTARRANGVPKSMPRWTGGAGRKTGAADDAS